MVNTTFLQKVRGPNSPPKTLMYKTCNGDWEPVTIPPLIHDLTVSELDAIQEKPLECKIPCHSQTVEHSVALVSQAAKRRRTTETQLMNVLQVSSARKKFKGRVTHKRFSKDLPDSDTAEQSSLSLIHI